MDLFIPARRDGGDESVAAFVRRRLGGEALEKIAEPLMGGIHVSDPEYQSLLGTFPRFRDLEVKNGSLIRGMLAQKRRRKPSVGQNGSGPADGNGVKPRGPSTPFITLRRGLGQLVQAVSGTLAGEIMTGVRVNAIGRATPANAASDDAVYHIATDDGPSLAARAVVLATPAYESGRMLEGLAPELAHGLGQIRYVSTATVSLGYRRADVSRPLDGFGFVVPRRENRRISACTWTSTKFEQRAPGDDLLVRCFVGGPGKEQMVDLEDAELLAAVREELQSIMGLDAVPALTRIFRWHKANAQYDVGHVNRVAQLRQICEAHPGLYLAGAAYGGVGVPDCVRQGKEAAQQAVSYLKDGKG
jgi:oxygen-dependent protoporphyrinogen oxidase